MNNNRLLNLLTIITLFGMAALLGGWIFLSFLSRIKG